MPAEDMPTNSGEENENPFVPGGKALTGPAQENIRIDLFPDGDMLILKMEQPVVNQISVIGRDARGPFIAIPRDTHVDITMELSTTWDWKFDNPAFHAKQASDRPFFTHRRHDDHKRMTLNALSTGRIPTDPGNERDTQPFSLMVLFAQPDGRRPLKIIIDPDVKNPPPRGTYPVAAGTWIPMLPTD